MVTGTLTWTSATQEFGFITPADGSRDVFTRLSPGIKSGSLADVHDERPLSKAVAVPVSLRDEGFKEHQPGSRVEIRTRYQRGQWARGYEVAGVVDSGYQVRRFGSREVLSDIFVSTDVRRAGDGR
jgi:hypothetical protein